MKTRGMVLLETLVAASLLGLGLLSAIRLSAYVDQMLRQMRQENLALALALEALDCATTSHSECPALQTRQDDPLVFVATLQLQTLEPNLLEARVQVHWQDGDVERQLERLTHLSTLPDWVGVSSP